MNTVPITILIADVHAITRNGLAKTIEAHEQLQVVNIADSIDQIETLCNHHHPGLIITGTHFPDIDNMKAWRYIAGQFPHIALIVIADDYDAESIVGIKTAGYAWLCKSATEAQIVDTIIRVHENTFIQSQPNHYLNHLQKRKLTVPLTLKQIGMIPFFCRGLTAKQVGEHTGLSPRTVQKHKDNIIVRLGGRGIAGMVAWCLRHDIAITTIFYWIIMLLSPGHRYPLRDGIKKVTLKR